MRFVRRFIRPFIVATSYENYISAVCDAIGFPMENTYCTALDMDSIKMEPWESDLLKRYAQEISRMELMEIPEGAKTVDDFSATDRETIRRLDEIFWEDLTDLSAYQLILEVNPVGGEEKASAVLDIRRRTGIGLEDTLYIGDSITDVQAFQLVREGNGLTISFNGNEYALREAEFAIISDNTVITSVLAEAFHKAGMEGINTLAEDWTMKTIRSSGLVNEYLMREFEKMFPENLPTVAKVTPQNMTTLTRQRLAFRRSVRGQAIRAQGRPPRFFHRPAHQLGEPLPLFFPDVREIEPGAALALGQFPLDGVIEHHTDPGAHSRLPQYEVGASVAAAVDGDHVLGVPPAHLYEYRRDRHGAGAELEDAIEVLLGELLHRALDEHGPLGVRSADDHQHSHALSPFRAAMIFSSVATMSFSVTAITLSATTVWAGVMP